ncbi:PE family protein [Mycobacterium sp. TY815]|uniref:PE family protein n=1 Tax=Mycobacterium sp. TY815 TaxID=3050581 RepID=UPI0027419FDB|nr:PE family protein [Mycobacterium sp. TY815]MDP7703084.1 PE family protein [Mycobacterium sp. TY815]
MTYVIAAPEPIAAATTDLGAIAATLEAAHLTAAASTQALLPAAADEVSAGIAHLFSGYAEDYQKLATRAATFHQQFVEHLTASAGSYAMAESANVASLLHPAIAATNSVAAAATDPSAISYYVGEAVRRIGFIASSIPALAGQLGQLYLTNPDYFYSALPLFLVGGPLAAGLYVSGPLLRLWVDLISPLYDTYPTLYQALLAPFFPLLLVHLITFGAFL